MSSDEKDSSGDFSISTVKKLASERIANAIGWGAIFIGLFFILSNLPIFATTQSIGSNAGLVIIFITGLLVSLHCVGMCSGFVVSYASKSKGVTPHLCYNGSRLLSYVALGALLGTIGAVFTFSDQLRSYLAIAAGLFMVTYGASLFFPQLRKFVSMPGLDVEKHAKKSPVLFGLLNGLMPCGPLQAMLIYAAGTGSTVQGALTMLAFGLGTIPLMFLMGTAVSVLSMKWTHKIVKFSGVMVCALGLILLGRGFLLSGIALPFISTASAAPANASLASALSFGNGTAVQEINMTVTQYGWQPSAFTVKKGIPVVWNVKVDTISSCVDGLKAPSLGISYFFQSVGETKTFEFTPMQAGIIYFTCPMGMVTGQIKVI